MTPTELLRALADIRHKIGTALIAAEQCGIAHTRQSPGAWREGRLDRDRSRTRLLDALTDIETRIKQSERIPA